MPGRAAGLVLLSALLHAVWNALVKREKNPRSAGLAVLFVATAAAAALTPFADPPAFPSHASLLWALSAGLFEGAYFATLGLALALGPLGPVYTVARGGAMLVAWPVSAVFLGEPFPWPARIGVILIGGGLALTALRPREHATPASLGWAAACAVCIGGYHLCYKLALEAGAEPRALFAAALACAWPINAVWNGRNALWDGWRALRASPVAIVAGGLTCTASFVLFLYALAITGAGAVLTLRNTSVLFAYLLAVAGGERPNARALGGAALVVVGTLLLTR